MSALSNFRQQYPEYNDTSDKDLADALHSKYYSDLDINEYYQQIGLVQSLDSVSADQPEGVGYYAGVPLEVGKGVVRGFGSGLLSAGAGLAELADVGTDLIGLDDLIDSGNENELIRLANEGKQALNESLGVGDTYKDNYLVKLGEGLGSIGSFFVPGGAFGLGAKALGGAARAQRIATTVGATTAGVGTGASDQAERIAAARARGEEISAGQEDLAIALGGLVGASEAIAPLEILKKIARFKDVRKNEEAFNAVTSALRTGAMEGTQEVMAGLAQNAIQDGVYSDNVNYTESLWDDFTVGAGAGALLDAMTNGVNRRRSKILIESEREREQAFRDEEAAASQELYDRAERAKQLAETDSVESATPLMSGMETFDQVEFDPTQPYAGQQVNMVDRAAEYASQIARSGIQRDGAFPESGKFNITEEKLPGGSVFKVIHSETGQEFGQPDQDRESAIHLMANLNQELINRRVNGSVIDSLDVAPQAYTPEQAESLYVIGQRLNRPKRFTITSAVLNEAAGTTQSPKSPYQEDKTIDQLHVNQYGVPPYSDRGEKFYQDLSNLTAAQEINLERRRQGLPEVQEFTLEEAKQVLGDKYSKVFDVLVGVNSPEIELVDQTTENFGSVGARLAKSRQEYQDQKRTLEEVSAVLKEKNITSDVNSPEVKYLLEKIVNETDVGSMSPSQRMHLVQEVRKLPVVSEPALLPDFRPKTYTSNQYNAAVQYVTETGDGTIENIESNLGDIGSTKRIRKVASDLQKAMKSAGLINDKNEVATRLSLPSPKQFQPEIKPYSETVSEDAANLEKLLTEDLRGMGLDDIRVRVLDALKIGPVTREGEIILTGKPEEETPSNVEGYYKARSNTVFLALDRIKQTARDQTPEARREALTDILNHEIVHGVRNLDLWTDQEWRLLENLARKKIFPGKGNVTFFNDAQERYTDLSAVGQMEEAVAEIVKYARKDKKFVSGKPKTLVERMYNFFEKTGNALSGTGFQSFDDVLSRLEKGEIGSRERDQIRTLKSTEKRLGAVPDRGIGLSRDVRNLAPQTGEEEVAASKQRDRAAEQGFDTDTPYYHGTVTGDIKKFRSDLTSIGFTDNLIAGHFTPNADFANKFSRSDEYGGRFLKSDERPAVYPVYLRPGKSFDAGKIFRERDPEDELQVLQDEVDNLSNPYYEDYAIDLMLKMSYDSDDIPAKESIIETRRDQLSSLVESIFAYPSEFAFAELEALAPFIRSAGYDSYVDYEYGLDDRSFGDFIDRNSLGPFGSTGIAMFKPDDIKGVYAQYDPAGVPEGYEYADDIMFSKKKDLKRTKTGQYVGAPKELNTPQKLGALRRSIKGLAEEGEGGRFWYEQSGKALLNITGGDRQEAKKLAQAIAITSPQTPVPSNFNYAVQAYYQNRAGQPIKTGMYPGWMSNALEDVFAGKDWEGRKTNNFYNNVMREIDATIDQGVTTDIWMMRAFGFMGDSPTDAQYTFVENEVKRLSKDLGWEPQQVQAAVWVAMKARTENKMVKAKTEEISQRKGYMKYELDPKTKKKVRVLIDPERHRQTWLNEAMKYDPTGAEKDQAKFDYSDAARNNLAQVSWESIPGATSGHLGEIFDAQYPEIQEYHVQISKAFLDEEGNDIVARDLGVLSPGDFEAPGYFEDRVSPGTQTQVVAPKRYKVNAPDFEIEPSSEDLIKAYAAVRGVLMKQDGVGYHRPFYDKGLRKKDLNGMEIDIGRPFTESETTKLAEIMQEYSGHGEYNPIGSDSGARLINFDYLEVDNNDFNNMVIKALTDMEFANGESATAGRFAAQAGYLGNDWSVNKNGESYIESLGEISPDLQRRVEDIIRRVQPRIDAVDKDFSERYGWTESQEINNKYKPKENAVKPDESMQQEEVVESRRRNASEVAAAFGERSPPGTIMHSVDNSPEVQEALIDQEILGEPFSLQTKGYSFGDKFVYQVADKLIGLKDAEASINRYRQKLGLSPLKATESAYIGEESISGILGNKMREFEERRKKPLAGKIADSGYSLDEVDEFLILRHAIERNERVASRDAERDVEVNPGSGKLKTGQTLTNSFVKRKMKERYDMDWNDATGTWSGGNGRAKRLLDVAADVDIIVNETIDETIAGGLLDSDSAEAVRNSYKYYAPLKGKDIEDDYAETAVIGSSISTKGKEFLRAMGRESAAQSPLGHVLLNAERSMARGTKNKQFGERLVNLIKSNPDEDFWRVISPEDPRYMRAFEKKFTYVGSDKDLQGQTFTEIPNGANRKDYIQKIVLKRDNLSPSFDQDLIGVKLDGKQVYVELTDKRLRDAIVGMDGGTADNLIQKFGVVNRFLSMVNTSLNPEFVIGNFSRDVQTAIFNILGEQNMSMGKAKDQRLVAKVLKDVVPSMGAFFKGARRSSNKDGTLKGNLFGMSPKDQADYKEFMESGSKADWFHSRNPEDQFKTVQSMIDMANGTFKGNFQRRFQATMQFIEDSNAAVENAVRLATFKASRDELLNAGVPRSEAVAQAASLSKNLTINFNRKGNAGDLVNSLYLFFNASVQGTANFARGLFGPKMNPFSPEASRVKQGAVTSLIMFGALSALRAEEESEENPETGRSYYSEIPNYVKERNMVIMAEPSEAPKKGASNIYLDKDGKEYANKSQYYYTIPLPYGYNVFHSLGQNVFEMSNGHISPLKATSNITSAFLGSFSPVGFASPAPTIAQPFVEIAKNENFFGSPIYRENFPTGTQLPESQLAMSTTRTPFKWMANIANSLTGGNEQESGAVDISPDVMEHLAEFMFGGAGKFGMRNFDAIEKWQKGEDLKVREIPFLRRIKGETDGNTSMADFYERKVRLEQKEARVDSLRGGERLRYRQDNSSYLRTLRDLEIAEKQLRSLRQQRKKIKELSAMSPANALKYGKAEEEIYDKMNSIYNRFNKAYDFKVGRTK